MARCDGLQVCRDTVAWGSHGGFATMTQCHSRSPIAGPCARGRLVACTGAPHMSHISVCCISYSALRQGSCCRSVAFLHGASHLRIPFGWLQARQDTVSVLHVQQTFVLVTCLFILRCTPSCCCITQEGYHGAGLIPCSCNCVAGRWCLSCPTCCFRGCCCIAH